jgi:hypothetical protein
MSPNLARSAAARGERSSFCDKAAAARISESLYGSRVTAVSAGDTGEASVRAGASFQLDSPLSARINKDETGNTHAMRYPGVVDRDGTILIDGNDARNMPAGPHSNSTGMWRRSREFQPGVGRPQIAHRMPEHDFARITTACTAERKRNTTLLRKPMRITRYCIGNSHLLVPATEVHRHDARALMKRGAVPMTVPPHR